MPAQAVPSDDFDFVIVGSGFGGSVSALRLAEKGYRVAVVQMGKRFRRQDFARTSWDLRRFLWRPQIGCHGIMQLTLLKDVFVMHGAGVGGGSLVYANTLLEPPARAFESGGWVGAGWREKLAPHYATAKRMLGVVPAPELYASDRALLEACKEMGREASFRRADVGVYFGEPGKMVADPYFDGRGPERGGCLQCGACMVGCRHGAKNSLDQNYLYLAERLGVTIIPERRVTRLVPRPEGGYELGLERSTGWLRGGQTLRAKNVVLAAGVLGTVPLLMRSRAAGFLPKLSRQLGDRVRTNSEQFVAVRARRDGPMLGGGIAISALADIDDKTHVEVVRYNEGSDFMGLLATTLTDGAGGPWRRRWRWICNLLRHPLRALSNSSPFGFGRRTAILMAMQPVDNHLTLSWGRRRWWPFGSALRSERATAEPVPVCFPAAHELARRMATRLGGEAQSMNVEIAFNVPTTAHILGGCPMGASEEDGVIDQACRVFGYDGLFVVDGSAVPANLGVNPSLTITALAEYAMSQVPPRPGASSTASAGASRD